MRLKVSFSYSSTNAYVDNKRTNYRIVIETHMNTSSFQPIKSKLILLNCLTVYIIHIEVDDIFLFFIYGKLKSLYRIMAPLDVFPSSAIHRRSIVVRCLKF